MRVKILSKKQYSTAESDFIVEWADRWFQLNQLLYDLFKFDETPSPPPPKEPEELNYQSLRRWFIDCESQIMPLWREFWGSLDWPSLLDDEQEITENLDAVDGILRNIFTDEFIEVFSSFFYDPENLFWLICGLGIQSRMDIWLPNEELAWKKMTELLQISNLVVAFVHWIQERT
mgnify:CR=1 FL=1